MTSSRLAAGVTALSLALAHAPHAYAQSQPSAQALETARNLYKQGKELRANGDIQGALEKFHETERSSEARADAANLAEELKARIPTLVVKVRGLVGGETASLVIDGVAVPAAAATEPQRIDPGKHEVVAKAGTGTAAREARAQTEIGEAETREVTVILPPPPPPRSEDTGALPAGEGKHKPPLTAAGLIVTGIGVAVGTFAGIAAKSKESALEHECLPNHGCPPGDPQSDRASATTLAAVSTIAFGVAGVGLVLTVVGIASGSGARASKSRDAGKMRASPWIGAGSAGLYGSF
jgi:hypothetical protein